MKTLLLPAPDSIPMPVPKPNLYAPVRRTVGAEMHPVSRVGKCAARACTASEVVLLIIGSHRVPICRECFHLLNGAVAIATAGEGSV